MDKKKALSILNEIVGEFVFKDRLPQRYQGDKTKLNTLVSYYGKPMITANVVNQVIGDLAFKDVLDKVKGDESKYKGEVKLSVMTEIDITAISKESDKVLSAIPQEYHFLLKLPKCENHIKNIKFSHNIEILSADDELIKYYYGEQNTEKDLRSFLFDLTSGRKKMEKGELILRVSGKGYVSHYSTIKLNIIDPLYVWKVIVGVYAGLDIIKRQDKAEYFRLMPEFTYDVNLATGEHIRSLSESTEDNQYISRMEFNPQVFELSEIDKLLKNTSTAFDYANEVLTNLFSEIRFAKGKTDENVVKQQRMIKNGAYWFYETLKTQQDHVRAIYATTSIDSLLGVKGNDDTKESKSKLVSISVSKDSLEGDGIRKAIIELYVLRNEIVHGSREISSLEQYGDGDEKPTKANMYYSVLILARFLKSRIHFVNGGIVRVLKLGVKRV
ncbi:hypothetical protein COV24_04895 [candidate division WWE3 bacterium CG10_big_fil_rev_8_21_14_0_10_32_10]|uniref:Uncharacterized protein n=1 Tax=candidate division WWE3 bacterium CG10_big_fil_rev_8_21_14_0_10_32_10 TaxID=1975090 RepID=A0A2H0R947_UNCKA|nr:MAG: hypothetical protein COV24_04895 [candidate division WWE3 bacterium CG10_big_fil_rev_8_21_14_0_10_32_10]